MLTDEEKLDLKEKARVVQTDCCIILDRIVEIHKTRNVSYDELMDYIEHIAEELSDEVEPKYEELLSQ